MAEVLFLMKEYEYKVFFFLNPYCIIIKLTTSPKICCANDASTNSRVESTIAMSTPTLNHNYNLIFPLLSGNPQNSQEVLNYPPDMWSS